MGKCCSRRVNIVLRGFISKIYLPSATKLRQGNIFTSVCQEFCSRGGVCLSACWDTTPQADPPGRHPRVDTPSLGRHHCSGWYASYWNAFLYQYWFQFSFSFVVGREEPLSVTCATCQTEFCSSWDLIVHAQQEHSLTIFAETSNNNVRITFLKFTLNKSHFCCLKFEIWTQKII